MTISVSVIVPTFRRNELLDRCLTALVMQNYDSERYEVIVVDDAADDDTRDLIDRRSGGDNHPSVSYLRTPGTRGPAAARNVGIRAARGGIVAFTDDDCIPALDWVEEGVNALSGGAAGACGKIVVPLSREPTDYELSTAELENAEFATANCFYRRDDVVSAGGFDERFTAAWREDADLFFTLLERGKQLVYAPYALVIHPARRVPWGESIRAQRKSQYNALLFKKHPRLYRQKIQQLPPLHYYVIDSSLAGMAGAAALGWDLAAVFAAGIWFASTGSFFLKRLRRTSRSPAHVLEMAVTSALIPVLSVFWRLAGAFRFRVLFA